MTRGAQFVSSVSAFMMILAVGLGAQGTAPKKNPVPATPASVEAGHTMYKKYCQFCHGESGKGDGPMAPEGSHPANLTTGNFKHGATDADLFATISNGVGPKFDMEGFKRKLKEQDIWNVINYVRSLGPHGSTR